MNEDQSRAANPAGTGRSIGANPGVWEARWQQQFRILKREQLRSRRCNGNHVPDGLGCVIRSIWCPPPPRGIRLLPPPPRGDMGRDRRLGHLTVLDRTNRQPDSRNSLTSVAIPDTSLENEFRYVCCIGDPYNPIRTPSTQCTTPLGTAIAD